MKQASNESEGKRNQKPAGTPKKWLWKSIFGILIFLGGLLFILVAVPVISPATGANMADFLRSIFGPEPVAKLESLSFQLHDELNRRFYQNSRPQIGWDGSTQASQPTLSAPTPASQATPIVVSVPTQLAPSVTATITATDVVSAGPQIGWQAYGPVVNGANVMARALINVDPQRPYTAVALVRIDISQLRLHLMPGSLEPPHSSQVVKAIPNLGMIPVDDQGRLVAAFNGGFKAVHGHFGMMVDGLTLLAPQPNIETVAIYRDGHIQIGNWGKNLFPSPDMIAFRQNCPPLIDDGQLNPDLANDNRKAWGYTNNNDITWRTSLGITQDNRYLIYAVGNGTSAQTLALALHDAGAYAAMELDVNQFYAHFETYQPSSAPTSNGFKLTAERLLDEMINQRHIYLTPNERDFFYLTTE